LKKIHKSPPFCFYFKYECVSSQGIYVYIGKDKYLCEYFGQNISISTMEYNTIYTGTIICPDCQIICSSLVCWKISQEFLIKFDF
jgi:hypothetical protein